MSAVKDFEELAIFQKAREHSASIMNFIKELKTSEITGAKYKP